MIWLLLKGVGGEDHGRTFFAAYTKAINLKNSLQSDLLELSKHGRVLTTKKQDRFKWIQERVRRRIDRSSDLDYVSSTSSLHNVISGEARRLLTRFHSIPLRRNTKMLD